MNRDTNKLACDQVEEMLSDVLEGSVPREAEEDFSAHLLTCNECDVLFAQVRGLKAGMHELKAVPVPAHLSSRIVSATLGPRESGWRSWLAWSSWIWQPQFAMGAVTVVASLLILLHVAGANTRDLTLADMNPAAVAEVANRRVHLAYAHGVRFVNDLRFVYDIESLLAPAPNDPGRQEQQEPSIDPRQKSNVVPKGNGTDVRSTQPVEMEAALAMALNSYRSIP